MSTATSTNTDNEASNDVMVVEQDDGLLEVLGESAGKPLMMLFLRLIGNDSKQNTVLTNAQIVDILQIEFGMDIVYTHELEIEIYLNLLKRFLKDWPQWDEFDFAINTLKDQKNIMKMKDMLETNYEGLKTYLKQTLDAVEPMLKKVIKEVMENTRKPSTHANDDVALLVQCSRPQFNNLFYRRPHPDLNHTLFNSDPVPAKIRVHPIPVESILNWPSVRITLSFNGLLFKREMIHTLKHLLVNKKLNYSVNTPKDLNTNFQMKSFSKVTGVFETEHFRKVLDKVRNAKLVNADNVRTVCETIQADLEEAPTYMQYPTSYRRILTKYPYVRHLYSEVNSDKFSVNNYDLQIQETAIPQINFHFIRFINPDTIKEIPSDGSFLKIECVLCECIFTGPNLFTYLQQHFELHQGEQDWQCTHCSAVLSMEQLTKARWQHNCQLISLLQDKPSESES